MRRLGGRLALVLLLALGAPTAGAAPPSAELPVPDLLLTVVPLALPLSRPTLEPPLPPPAPAPTADLGLRLPPVPRFQTLASKPVPLVRDPGGTSCTFAFGRPGSLADCGVHRFFQGDLRGAREALEDSLQRDPRGPQAGAAYVWLGEVAFRERRSDEAERHYRSAIALAPPADLLPHASLGLAWIALWRGDLTDAQRGLAAVLSATPPQGVVVAARFLEGVVQLQAGRPQEALRLWDAVAGSGPPPQLAEELLFWRGIAFARLGQPDPALQTLDGFLGTVPATHPLRADAIVQSGWVALARNAADDAVRRFLWAQNSTPRPDVMSQIRAGLARAYLALGDSARARDVARLLKADSARDPLLPPVLLLIADDAVRRQATAEAVEMYRELQGLQLDPQLGEYATYRLAEASEQLGSRPDAERHYRDLRNRGRVEALAQRAAYRLALLALRAQRPAEARAEGEELLRAGVVSELREGVILLAGEAAARADDPNRAVALLRLALRDYSTSPRAGAVRLILGWALLKDGDPELALREWHRAALANDLEVAVLAHLAIAQVALQQGRESESLAALRELARLAPSHPLADVLALNRGILLVRAKEYPEAVQELEPLVARMAGPPGQAVRGIAVVDLRPVLRRALGIARFHLKQFEAAERDFAWARHLAPAEPSHALGEGLAALAQNRFAEADRALRTAKLAAASEIALPATFGLVLVAERRRDPDLFRERAAEFADRYPAHPYTELLVYHLALQTAEQRQLDQADGWVKRLLRDHPKSALVAHALATLAQTAARDRPGLARQAYERLLGQTGDPELRTGAWLGIATAARALRDVPGTQRALEGFLAEAPPDDPRAAEVLALLVEAFETQGQRDRTLAATEAFLARFPGHSAAPGIQLRRGYLLLIAQQWDPALQALETARNTGDAGTAASAHFYLGELHRSRGDYEAALGEYLSAAYVYPDTMPWAARGLQGAIQSFLARQQPREASGLLRKLLGRPGLEPEVAEWAQDRLARLGPITGEDPGQVLRKGAAR